MRPHLPAILAVSAAVTWTGAVAPEWPAAAGMTTGAWPPGAGDASAIGAARPAGSWGRAIEVPGLGALNKGGFAGVLSVSCGSAGSCAAGGYYRNRHGHPQGFVAAERNGVWGRAIEVPGLAALSKWDAEVTSVSCGSAGNCAAGGYYIGRSGDGQQGFVVSERNGVWGLAVEVPGLAALNKGRGAQVLSVSCGTAGNCAAGGFYTDGDDNDRGFVTDERNGRWSPAIQVPGLAALNTGGDAQVTSMSCASAGNCTAGGNYVDSAGVGSEQGFVAAERDRAWGTAVGVPGLAALNAGGQAEVTSVSCGSPGNCAAGGAYAGHSGLEGFVAAERNGAWGTAIEVPGLAALNVGGIAGVVSVSCAPGGSCAAGGDYAGRHHHGRVFVVSENNGVWGAAFQVPGLGALSRGARVMSVSCGPAGTCAAGGSYGDAAGHAQGFVTQAR